MRVVIVDDEELARARLRRMLAAHGDVEIVGDFGNAARAVTEVPALLPDLVLLDIRMPCVDGFAVAAALNVPCEVVFVTAWSDHAVHAFRTGAVDYLMKPVDSERLSLALDRVRTRLPQRQSVSRLAVRDQGRFLFLSLTELDAAIANGNYVELRAAKRTYQLRTTLTALEHRLDPAAFVRIHRSVIVRIERITAIEPLFRGEYLVCLADGSSFTSARGHRAQLRRVLGL